MSKLDSQERAILSDFEKGELQSVDSPSHDDLKEAASNTFKQDQQVSIHLSENDLELIQERASQEGVPYETLMSSVLHKFVNGRLVESGA